MKKLGCFEIPLEPVALLYVVVLMLLLLLQSAAENFDRTSGSRGQHHLTCCGGLERLAESLEQHRALLSSLFHGRDKRYTGLIVDVTGRYLDPGHIDLVNLHESPSIFIGLLSRPLPCTSVHTFAELAPAC
jgi:hypothetical protein